MKYVTTFLTLLLIYLLLAGFTVDEVILGSIISVFLTVLSAKYFSLQIDYKFPIRLVKFIFIYIPVFFWKLLLANLDIARRVLSPKIPLKPGIVKVPTELKGDLAKLTLANSITLTPGTLSIDIIEEHIYVHTVEVKGKTEAENQKVISGPFERILGGVFK